MYKIADESCRRYLVLFTCCILTGSAIYCKEKERNTNMENGCDFFSIEINTFDETACSPAVDEEFRGIIIAAPDTVTLSNDIPFVICGTAQLNRRYEFQFDSPDNELTLVIENISIKKVWSCNLLEPGYETPPKNPDMTIEDIHPEEFSTSWFNIDIFRYLPDMPRAAGIYTVYATLGDYTSNTVIVKLEEK